MPIELKIEWKEYKDGTVWMRPVAYPGEELDPEPELQEMPCTSLDLHLRPQHIPTVDITFMVKNGSMFSTIAKLADVSLATIICPVCQEFMVQTTLQLEDGTWMKVWICDCMPDMG